MQYLTKIFAVAFLVSWLLGCRNAGATLVPGSAIGLVRLGMTRGEIAGLGLEVRPYQVLFDGDRVASIAFKLTGSGTGLVVGGRALSESATIEELARLLPGCRPAQVGEGGTVISCGGGTTLLKSAAGSPTTVEVQVMVAGFVTL